MVSRTGSRTTEHFREGEGRDAGLDRFWGTRGETSLPNAQVTMLARDRDARSGAAVLGGSLRAEADRRRGAAALVAYR